MSDPTGTDVGEPPLARRTRNWGTLAVSIASVIVSYAALNFQRTNGKEASDAAARSIKLGQANADREDKAEDARRATQLIPFLRCNDDMQRQVALALVPASYYKEFADALSANCRNLSPASRSAFTQLQSRATIQQQIDAFLKRIANVREYRAGGFDGPAARLFNDASTSIPSAFNAQVNKDEVSRAARAFTAGDFREASDRFAEAFRSIPGS